MSIPVDRQEIWLVKNREPGETDTRESEEMRGDGGNDSGRSRLQDTEQ